MLIFRQLLITAAIVAGFTVSPVSQAVGVRVMPENISLSEGVGRLLVVNDFGEPAAYRIYPDQYQSIITVDPQDFRLMPNERQLVTISAKPQWLFSRLTDISVVAVPLGGSGVKVGSGIKIPILLNSSLGVYWLVILVGLAVCSILVFVVLLRRKSLRQI